MKPIKLLTIIVLSIVFYSCKKEYAMPSVVNECCINPYSTVFSIQNSGSTSNTFRIYGGGLGLLSVENNGVVYNNVNQFTFSSSYQAALYVDEYKFIYLSSGIFDVNTNTNVSTNNYTWYAYDSVRKLVYAMNMVSYTIDVLNPASSNSIVTSFSIESGLNTYGSIIYSSQSDRLYYHAFANSGDAFIYVINPNNYIISKIQVSGTPEDYTVSEYPVFYNNIVYSIAKNSSNPTMMMLNALTNTAKSQVSLTPGYSISSYSPIVAGSNIYFLAYNGSGDGLLYKYNTLNDTFITYPVASFDIDNFSQLFYNSNTNSIILSYVTESSSGDNNYIVSFDISSGTFSSNQINEFDTTEYIVCRIDNGRNLIYGFKAAGPDNNYVHVMDGNDLSVVSTINLPSDYFGETTYYVTDNQDFQFIGSSAFSGKLQYFTTSDSVEIVVNGGQNTIQSVNNDTLTNPICVCKLKIDTDNKSAYSTSLAKKEKTSNGVITSEYINLLSKYTAAQSQGINVVEVNGSEFSNCVLDGENYLEWVVPANSSVEILVEYCQYQQPTTFPKKKSIKRYNHGSFKYWINR